MGKKFETDERGSSPRTSTGTKDYQTNLKIVGHPQESLKYCRNSESPEPSKALENSMSLTKQMLANLPHDELVSQLIKAQKRIQELERAKALYSKEGDDTNFISWPQFGTPSYAEDENDSPASAADYDSKAICFELVEELKAKFEEHNYNQERGTNGDQPTSLKSLFDEDEVIVAYQHKGDFPGCDEDLSMTEEDTPPRPQENIDFAGIIVHDGVWSTDEEIDGDGYSDTGKIEILVEDNANDQIVEFPLIPSPVINTPPYEYIFLTKENEARCRIFLNPKLNQVFQEELAKLRNHDNRNRQKKQNNKSHQSGLQVEQAVVVNQGQNQLDFHNKNHIINTSPSEVDKFFGGNVSSCPNVIHCFDPSDVDLELKRIFTEKPPITHKIVRRRSRKERGSSVPAVDSYYGTQDLNKVGHASYFIPTLTESERKAIGWKPEYHYGHWKYSDFKVPNLRTNPISLHPHPHLEDLMGLPSHHHHHHHHHHSQNPYHHPDPLLCQNPLHQKEINLSDAFLLDSEAQSLIESADSSSPGEKHFSRSRSRCRCHTHATLNEAEEDPLSFITLSGSPSDPSSASCHIIPNSCALRRILKWLLPACMRAQHESEATSNLPSGCTTGTGISSTVTEGSETPQSGDDEEGQSCKGHRVKKSHEIETLVSPTSKAAFPSDTNLSFASMMKCGGNGKKDKANPSVEDTRNLSPLKSTTDDGSGKQHQHNHHHTQSHHPHHNNHNNHHHHHHQHHHGFFHWKNILSHGAIKTAESMSVVGGDVVDSGNPSSSGVIKIDVVHVDKEDPDSQGIHVEQRTISGNIIGPSSSAESDTTDSEIEGSQRPSADMNLNKKAKRNGKKLKACKAFKRLLTLKDLGYETDEGDDGKGDTAPQEKN